MEKFKAGDKIVFGNRKKNKALTDVTIGKIYPLILDWDSRVSFIDDAGDYNYYGITHPAGLCFDGKATKIID